MTVITINIPNKEISFFKKMISKMGWTYEVVDEKPKACLYNPETGEQLNSKTMKTIEDMRNGKDLGTTYASYEDFENAMRKL